MNNQRSFIPDAWSTAFINSIVFMFVIFVTFVSFCYSLRSMRPFAATQLLISFTGPLPPDINAPNFPSIDCATCEIIGRLSPLL